MGLFDFFRKKRPLPANHDPPNFAKLAEKTHFSKKELSNLHERFLDVCNYNTGMVEKIPFVQQPELALNPIIDLAYDMECKNFLNMRMLLVREQEEEKQKQLKCIDEGLNEESKEGLPVDTVHKKSHKKRRKKKKKDKTTGETVAEAATNASALRVENGSDSVIVQRSDENMDKKQENDSREQDKNNVLQCSGDEYNEKRRMSDKIDTENDQSLEQLGDRLVSSSPCSEAERSPHSDKFVSEDDLLSNGSKPSSAQRETSEAIEENYSSRNDTIDSANDSLVMNDQSTTVEVHDFNEEDQNENERGNCPPPARVTTTYFKALDRLKKLEEERRLAGLPPYGLDFTHFVLLLSEFSPKASVSSKTSYFFKIIASNNTGSISKKEYLEFLRNVTYGIVPSFLYDEIMDDLWDNVCTKLETGDDEITRKMFSRFISVVDMDLLMTIPF